MTACDSDFGSSGGTDSRLNGTWVSEEAEQAYGWDVGFTFNNGSFEIFYKGPELKGTYITISNSSITFTPTHGYGGVFVDYFADGGNPYKWYSRNELRAFGVPEDELEFGFSSKTSRYSISGNTLYLIDADEEFDISWSAYIKR
jgi:hypothetical protein